MLVYLGSFYILLGTIILIMPLIYIEFGRPRDLIKAGLNLIIGMILIIKNSMFDNLYLSILIFVSILVALYVLEIFSLRWNQLTDQEKNKLRTLVELKKNLAIFLESISLVFRKSFNLINFLKFDKKNENLIKKKWVRNDENVNILSSNKNKLVNLEMKKKTTIESVKDIIQDKENK